MERVRTDPSVSRSSVACALSGLGAHIQVVGRHLVPLACWAQQWYFWASCSWNICRLFKNPHFVEICALSLDLITPKWWPLLIQGS